MSDGSLSLHARSLKYGRLENGCAIAVPPLLIKRLKQHFVTLPCGVDVILGTNGTVWMTETVTDAEFRAAVGDGAAASTEAGSEAPAAGGDGTATGGLAYDDATAAEAGVAEAIERRKAYAAGRVLTPDARSRLARVHNAIAILRGAFLPVSPDTITAIVDAVGAGVSVADMLTVEHATRLAAVAAAAAAAGGV